VAVYGVRSTWRVLDRDIRPSLPGMSNRSLEMSGVTFASCASSELEVSHADTESGLRSSWIGHLGVSLCPLRGSRVQADSAPILNGRQVAYLLTAPATLRNAFCQVEHLYQELESARRPRPRSSQHQRPQGPYASRYGREAPV